MCTMIVLTLNSRGMGSSLKQKAIKTLILQHKVDLICVQETKLQVVDLRSCNALWGDTDFDWESVPAENRSGGLLCIWRKSLLQIHHREVGQNFICIVGHNLQNDMLCCFVNVYAPCDMLGKRLLWDKLISLKNSVSSDLWCVSGDFNAVRSPSERRGATGMSSSQRREAADFNEFIDRMELLDIPLVGRKFTWVRPNGQQMSRLDRVMVSSEWLNHWPGYVQEVLPRDISDHCPLLFRISTQNWGPKPFRVLNCWFDDPKFKRFVEETWKEIVVYGRGAYVLKEKLKLLKQKLKHWNNEVFGDLFRKKKEIVESLNALEQKAEEVVLEEAELEQRKELGADYWRCAKRIESLLCQKSRIRWVKEGDANSKFFHAMVNFKRKTNALTGLHLNGVWSDNPITVKEGIRNFFADKFRAAQWERPKLDGVYFKTLTDSDSSSLEESFTLGEIKEAVWSCACDKSPGPDGINFRFIKAFWSLLHDDFKRLADEFFDHGVWPRGANASFIALISKVDSPQGLNDFRPISLVNCMYKVISKILAIRLRGVISNIIDDCQSAFVGERNMLDSVLVANEIIHEAKRRKKSSFVLKIDFEKAYDTVDWEFLLYMLRRLKFGEKWVQWIKACLASASVSVLVNGSPSEEFRMEKGLRQGDPLAPFLFLIVAEGLSGLVRQAVLLGQFSPFKLDDGGGLHVSLLQFADDTIFLGEASMQNTFVVKSILRCFELVSGLKVNFHKSKIAGVCAEENWLRSSVSLLHCKHMGIPFIYLGLPVGGNPRRISFWDPVISKLQARLSRWKGRHLSFGGRLCLIKAVLSSLPLYYLSFFKMPVGVMSKCNSIMRRFLWGGSEGDAKIAWVRWEQVCKSFDEGGLGVKDLKSFNCALLGKWRWRLLMEENSLWCRVLNAKYKGTVKPLDSCWWKDIMSVCVSSDQVSWFDEAVSRRIGDGNSTRFWDDDWWGVGPLKLKFPRLFLLSSQKDLRIAEMGAWAESSWQWNFVWNRSLLDRELIRVEELKRLLQSFSPKIGSCDTWVWTKECSGCYSVKSAYTHIHGDSLEVENHCFRLLWSLKAPSSSKALAWKVILNKVQTRSALLRRNALPANVANVCGLCSFQPEDSLHLFFDCLLAWRTWSKICEWIGVSMVFPRGACVHFEQFGVCLGRGRKFQAALSLIWVAVVGSIWFYRNNAVFKGDQVEVDRIVELSQFKTWLWWKANNKGFVYSIFEWTTNPVCCLESL